MKDYRGGMTMHDAVDTIGFGSKIQHGKQNDRIYLMKLDERDVDNILDELSKLAEANKYTKLFCKVPKNIAPLFFANGYILEGFIPNFYSNKNDVFFISKFLNPDRLQNIEENELLRFNRLLSKEHSLKPNLKKKTAAYSVRKLTESDAERMTQIYRNVFKTYPFPIHDPAYILKTMAENVFYFGVENEGNLIALASSEVDIVGKNAEMTDFATLQNHGGKSLASLLLMEMEKEMQKQGVKTLYTIARLNSVPMNKTFLRFDYEYSGTLINNTNISGKIESMNIYYKHI
jgi:putative beta-lysine N-acetyltransferase